MSLHNLLVSGVSLPPAPFALWKDMSPERTRKIIGRGPIFDALKTRFMKEMKAEMRRHPDEFPLTDWEDESNEPDEMREVPENDELCPNGRSLDEEDGGDE